MTSESTRPVREQTRKLRAEHRGSLLLQRFPGVLRFGDGKSKVISEAPTLCPGLTCSQEADSQAAEEPGAHGSIKNPGLPLAGGRSPGVCGESTDPPASLIGAFAYDVTAVSIRLPLSIGPLTNTQGWLLYALPCPDSPLASLAVR